MSSEYIVIVQGETFRLSKAQIELDSPNFFTEHFLDQNSASEEKRLELSRNPHLFMIIVEYLCGYAILPMSDSVVPARMSAKNALINLRVDAEFFKLKGLKELIDTHILMLQTHNKREDKELAISSGVSSYFHFPGRIVNWTNWGWNHYPAGYMEFPISIDLSKSFTIACWFRARSRNGWHTLISIDVPSAPHPLIYISISPEGDFRFEIGIRGNPDRFSSQTSSSSRLVNLNVWTHLAFTQQVNESGPVGQRILYINGAEQVSTPSNPPFYNPSPSQTRMAIMRGSWDHNRSAGFIGQAENISVFQRAIDQNEVIARASRANAPADHGWAADDQVTTVY